MTGLQSKLLLKSSPSRAKTSKIKFKEGAYEPVDVVSRPSSASDRSSTTNWKLIKHDETDTLDPNKCYHKDCSFAYNLTKNIRRESLVVECIPEDLYKSLAHIWHMNPNKQPKHVGNTCHFYDWQKEEEDKMVDGYVRNVGRDMGLRSDVSEDLLVNDVSEMSANRVNISKAPKKDNVYLKLLKRMERIKREDKKMGNFGKKAGRITKAIIKKFLTWYESLGSNEEGLVLDEASIHQLFRIGFDMPAAKTVAVRIREMPTIPESLATLKDLPKYGTAYALRHFLREDIKMENIPKKLFAFGSMLPKGENMRYIPPNNSVRSTWMECSRVPKDLDTMKTVWSGLEKLRSTIAFANWLKNHPEITPPAYLKEKGLLEINYEEWIQIYKEFEVDMKNDEAIEGSMKTDSRPSAVGDSKISFARSNKHISSESVF